MVVFVFGVPNVVWRWGCWGWVVVVYSLKGLVKRFWGWDWVG